MENRKPAPVRPYRPAIGGLLALLLAACSSYRDRVAPIPLPSQQPEAVRVEGAVLVARAYLDGRRARQAFGFDIRGAGLLPVQLVIDNQSAGPIRIVGAQSFLIDREGQAWPLLSANQAYDRVQGSTELGSTLRSAARPGFLGATAGAIAGLAIGILTGQDAGEAAARGAAVGAGAGAIAGGLRGREDTALQIGNDLAQRSLRNQKVEPGQLAHGYLFFPGKNEASSAIQLRLALEANGRVRVVSLPLYGLR